MTRKEALRIAIECVKLEYNRLLFGSDSKVSDEKRIKLAQAMTTLETMKGQREMF